MIAARALASLVPAACLLTACGGGSAGSVTPPSVPVSGGTSAVYVANVRLANVMRFAADANGSPTPTVIVQGGLTPNAMAFDTAGNLYVAGTNNAITVYKPFTSTASATIANSQICKLGGIAIDASGAVYISDPICDQILKLVPQSGGAYALAWSIAGTRTALSGPSGVAVDSSGDVFALNQPDSVHSAPAAVTEYSPVGASGPSNLTPIATITGGSFPTDVRGFGADADGDVFVASPAQIGEYVHDASGYHLAGTIADTNLCGIESIATAQTGSGSTLARYVIAANSCGPRSTGNGTLTTFDVTTPLSGTQDPTPLVVAGSATSMFVSTGSALAFDGTGSSGASTYVGNPLLDTVTGYCLCSSGGPPQYQLALGYPGLDGVQAIWFAGGRMYSSDGSTPAISVYAQPPDGAPAPLSPAPLLRIQGSNTRFCGTASVVTDRSQNVYVSNDCSTSGGGANSNTLERFDAPSLSAGGNQNLTPAWITTGGPCPGTPSASTLCNPQQLAIDPLGNIYVTNYGGNSIVEYSSSGTLLSVMTANPLLLHRPSGIAIDSTGNLIVYSDAEADAFGNYPGLVEYFARPTGSGTVTLSAIKTLSGSGTTLPSSQFGQIALDPQGNLFINLFKTIVVYAPAASGDTAPIRTITLPSGAGGTGLAISPAP
ncbi:MAG TPA: hypothetical protein VFO29_10485 [Candidatus Rubrimentiphilum sp.]|nr:hypothetical protein [Candidatus Rubrimentiphilum sp.]